MVMPQECNGCPIYVSAQKKTLKLSDKGNMALHHQGIHDNAVPIKIPELAELFQPSNMCLMGTLSPRKRQSEDLQRKLS